MGIFPRGRPFSTSMPQGPGLGLYVHLPFCRVKCSYCAFAVSTDLRLQDRYLAALQREIAQRSELRVQADSLFWGGGTPSRTPRAHLEVLDAAIRRHFDLVPQAEVTLEANPEDVTRDAVAQWRALGVNRLSIGVQSFHDDELIPLGRVHGRARALEAVRIAVDSGLRTSLDLIGGLPGQTPQSFLASLDLALSLGIGHLSVYMLDLEEGSALERRLAMGLVEVPEEESVARMYLATIERAAAAGLEQYELSNFARPGEESRHNLRYWMRRPYFGFGAGAHSFVGRTRTGNLKNVRSYIEALERDDEPVESVEELSREEVAREILLLSLRRTSGIGYPDLLRLTGGKGESWTDTGMREGWLARDEERIRFTPAGFLLSNELLAQLF